MGIIGGTVLVMSSHGAEQLIVQRVLACKSVRDGRKALVLSAVVIFPLFLIFLLVGAMLCVFYQGHPFQIPLPEPRPGSGIKANDFIFPIFMMTEVPHVLRGFLIVAILSAAMSSVSSALTSLASVSTMDFVKHLLPRRDRGVFPALQQALDRGLGRGPDPGRLPEPAGGVCAQRGVFFARTDQRRPGRRFGLGRLLARAGVAGGGRDDRLAGFDDCHPGAATLVPYARVVDEVARDGDLLALVHSHRGADHAADRVTFGEAHRAGTDPASGSSALAPFRSPPAPLKNRAPGRFRRASLAVPAIST